jgi:threonylcarbamoyladenosine tRNA methylthiotransferase MtaB
MDPGTLALRGEGKVEEKIFSIHVLGCKVNQHDAASLSLALEKLGLRRAKEGDSPHIIIVQTCTVTGEAERQNLQLMRKLKMRNPQALIIASGCQVQAHGEILEGSPWVDLAYPNCKRGELIEHVAHLCQRSEAPIELREEELLWGEGLVRLPGRTRAYLKVQDGCSGACSYCIVPKARGPSRSRPIESILRTLRAMEESGTKEVVITGVQLAAYGMDLDPPFSLPRLIEEIQSFSIPRIRLSSIEPHYLDKEVMDVICSSSKICHHIHIPIQSGSDQILSSMKRPYTARECREKILWLKERIPDLTIGADIIVGFPGESQKEFRKTLEFLESIPWSYLHVFPFSPRPGTEAYTMERKVDQGEIKRRASLLRAMSRERRSQWMESFVGREVEVLLEGPSKRIHGWMQGKTSNYLKVLIPQGKRREGDMVRVRIEGGLDGELLGREV